MELRDELRQAIQALEPDAPLATTTPLFARVAAVAVDDPELCRWAVGATRAVSNHRAALHLIASLPADYR